MFRLSHFAAPAVLGAALFVGGCAQDRDMPGNAQVMSEGRQTVSATAPHDGTVYVYDDTSHKTIYTGRVNKDDSIKLDAKDNKVMLNNQTALKQDLVNDHRYQILFERNESGDAMTARHREGDTTIQPNGNNGTTFVQPDGSRTTVIPPQQQPNTTIIQPPPSNTTVTPSGTTAQPNGAVVQPNGTAVQPYNNGGTTVTTPPPAPAQTR
jgi:hypothetical protein